MECGSRGGASLGSATCPLDPQLLPNLKVSPEFTCKHSSFLVHVPSTILQSSYVQSPGLGAYTLLAQGYPPGHETYRERSAKGLRPFIANSRVYVSPAWSKKKGVALDHRAASPHWGRHDWRRPEHSPSQQGLLLLASKTIWNNYSWFYVGISDNLKSLSFTVPGTMLDTADSEMS